MSKNEFLSSRFNMSLGFIPVIASIIVWEFTAQNYSIYMGAGLGILYSVYILGIRRDYVPNFILYCTTGVLLLFALAALSGGDLSMDGMLPLALETGTLIPVVVIFLNRKRLSARQDTRSDEYSRHLYEKGAESTIVSTKVTVIIASVHYLAILIATLVSGPLSGTARDVLLHYGPPAVFLLSILHNQLGILYFNYLMNHATYVPVVNTQGGVIGKSLVVDAITRKNAYINPVIRIAVFHNGMLYLSPRPQWSTLDAEKIDLPLECYLIYGENLEQAIRRLLGKSFPQAPVEDLRFNVMYHFENEVTNRLIYLFLIDIEDERLLHDEHLRNGKLWTLQLIECNLGKGFFSSCFENEYEHLKEAICIREKYKES